MVLNTDPIIKSGGVHKQFIEHVAYLFVTSSNFIKIVAFTNIIVLPKEQKQCIMIVSSVIDVKVCLVNDVFTLENLWSVK